MSTGPSHGDGFEDVLPGTVYLVGAGPGAVGMLTVRATQVLASCDAVLHDRLVPLDLVRLAKPEAEVYDVGKDAAVSSEKMKEQQDSISAQLVALARRGLSVCRLKGGDPMVYGRAGEEMEELALAGVPYEVVPGVTAMLAASADARVPLTYRKLSTSVKVYTMNSSTIRESGFDWAQFAAPSTTHVLYMGLSVLGAVCERMLAAGVPKTTTMAVVDRASLPCVQVLDGTVETLPTKVQGRPDLQGPALVLLGDVVGLRARLEGRRPSTPTQPASLTAASALLHTMGDEDLRSLRCRIDSLLAERAKAPTARPLKRPADE